MRYPIKVFYSEEDKGFIAVVPVPSTEEVCSGKILARTPKSLHKALLQKAREEGVSLNQLVVYLLSRGIEKKASL